jgi:hypothetical protein
MRLPALGLALCAFAATGLAQNAPSSIQRGPFGAPPPSAPSQPDGGSMPAWRPAPRDRAPADSTPASAPADPVPGFAPDAAPQAGTVDTPPAGSSGAAAPPATRAARTRRRLQASVAPKISIAPAPRAFFVAAACKAGAPLVTLNVVVSNQGASALGGAGMLLVAQDEGKVSWAGETGMPKLAAGESKTVSIPVYPPTHLSRADGTHRFSVLSPIARTAAPIAVTLPAGVCGGLAARFRHSAVFSKAVVAKPIQTSAMGYPKNTSPSAATTQSRAPALTAEDLRLAGRLRVNKLAAPAGAASTADPKTCTDHGGLGGGLACAALLPQGRLALVWSWAGTAADGFNVYRVDGGQRTRVGRQANGKDVTLYVIDPVPADGYSGKCYAVSAYRGAEESDLSAPACTDGGTAMQTATLTPGAADSSTRANQIQTGIADYPAGEIYVYDSGVYAAGYDYYREVSFWGDFARSQFSRLAILFDTSPLSNKTIYTAHLKLTVATTKVNQDPDPKVNSDHSTSCVKRVGLATANWWLYHGDWIEVPAATAPRIDQVGPNVDIDVTDFVRGWAQAPKTNFGIVLMGDNENLSTFTNAACRTAYDPASVQLQVQFF